MAGQNTTGCLDDNREKEFNTIKLNEILIDKIKITIKDSVMK